MLNFKHDAVADYRCVNDKGVKNVTSSQASQLSHLQLEKPFSSCYDWNLFMSQTGRNVSHRCEDGWFCIIYSHVNLCPSFHSHADESIDLFLYSVLAAPQAMFHYGVHSVAPEKWYKSWAMYEHLLVSKLFFPRGLSDVTHRHPWLRHWCWYLHLLFWYDTNLLFFV